MKTSAKIPDVDFPALLEEAKAVHAEMKAELLKCVSFPQTRAATDKWSAWMKKNLSDRGIEMTVEAGSGTPTSLFVYVAGKPS